MKYVGILWLPEYTPPSNFFCQYNNFNLNLVIQLQRNWKFPTNTIYFMECTFENDTIRYTRLRQLMTFVCEYNLYISLMLLSFTDGSSQILNISKYRCGEVSLDSQDISITNVGLLLQVEGIGGKVSERNQCSWTMVLFLKRWNFCC